MESSELIFSYDLKDNLEDFSKWRLTITEFRGVQYLNIREYFLDFDGEFQPTKKGLTVPLEMEFTKNLFRALKLIVSEGEQNEV